MFHVAIAGHNFTVFNQFSYVEKLCADYLTDAPGVEIRVSAAERAYENKEKCSRSEGYLESLAVYRKICEHLIRYDIMLFHGSALALDGEGYLFTAPSGTGKSTHARLWRQRFGDRAVSVNDDKPLLMFKDGLIYACGTPYAGKERLQTNTMVPVRGIVVLHQAPKNSIVRLLPHDAYPLLFAQSYRPKDPAYIAKTMDLVGRLAALPVYSLGCNISQEAVTLAYSALTTKNGEIEL